MHFAIYNLHTVTYISKPLILVPRYFSSVLGWEYFGAVIRMNSVRVLGYNPMSISLLLLTFQYTPVTVYLTLVQLKAPAVHYNSLANNSNYFYSCRKSEAEIVMQVTRVM